MILASAQSSMFQAPFQKTLFTNVNTISNSEDKNKKIKFIPLSCSGGQSIFWKQQSNDYREEIPRKKYQKPKEKLITALFPGIDQLIPGIDTFSKEYFSKKKVNHMLQIIPFLYEKNKDKINFDIINMNFTEDKIISKPHPKKNNHLKRISNAPKIEKWEIGPIISNSINLEKKNVNDDEMNDETSCESSGEEKNEKETQHMEITTKETPHFYVNKAILELREIINKPKVIEEPTYNNNLNKENPKITPIPNIKNVSISQSDKNIFSGFGKIDTKTILKNAEKFVKEEEEKKKESEVIFIPPFFREFQEKSQTLTKVDKLRNQNMKLNQKEIFHFESTCPPKLTKKSAKMSFLSLDNEDLFFLDDE